MTVPAGSRPSAPARAEQARDRALRDPRPAADANPEPASREVTNTAMALAAWLRRDGSPHTAAELAGAFGIDRALLEPALDVAIRQGSIMKAGAANAPAESVAVSAPGIGWPW